MSTTCLLFQRTGVSTSPIGNKGLLYAMAGGKKISQVLMLSRFLPGCQCRCLLHLQSLHHLEISSSRLLQSIFLQTWVRTSAGVPWRRYCAAVSQRKREKKAKGGGKKDYFQAFEWKKKHELLVGFPSKPRRRGDRHLRLKYTFVFKKATWP